MADIQIHIGTEADVIHVDSLASAINGAYGHTRISASSVKNRLIAGSAGERANRILHVAMKQGRVVGCCSSTLFVPWCGPGCGHWGLLAVSPDSQDCGVASALVAAAEDRLLASGMSVVQIEYKYKPGHAISERLYGWYEEKLGYRGPSHRRKGFRMCRKQLLRKGHPAGGDTGLARFCCSFSLFADWLRAVLAWLFLGRY